MKIGLITFHNVYNYGGILQAFALCEAISDKNVECIDYKQKTLMLKYDHSLYSKNKSLSSNLKHFVKYFILNRNRVKEAKMTFFIKNYIPLSSETVCDLSSLNKVGNKYDILIVGSDQVWNPLFTGGLDSAYLLEFGRQSAKRIAYASSAGAYSFLNEDEKVLKEALKDFSSIGVREDFLKNQLQNFIENEIKVVLDPTLLLTADQWRKIYKRYAKVDGEYILIYSFDDDPICLKSAYYLASKYNCKVVSLAGNKKKQKGVDIFAYDAGPEEYLWLIDNAKFIFTNSFHGTTFSTIFQKQFYSIYKKSNPHRAMNYLEKIGLDSRILHEVIQNDLEIEKIEYYLVDDKLDSLRTDSLNFLNKAILN